jgi:hypothetical protein
MAKKNRVSELDLPPVEIVVAPMPELPTETVVNETIAKVTGKKNPTSKPSEKKKASTSSDKVEKSLKTKKNVDIQPVAPQILTIQKTYGRPKKEKSAAREKYTTWLNGDLIVEIKHRAAIKRCSPADIIEEIISTYIQNY